MAKKAEPVRFAPEASHIPAWDARHPLFKQFGSATWEVQTAHGAARVEIPAVEDTNLTEIIASLAVYFTGTFIKSHRDMGYVIAECVAQAYEELGGTPEAWRAYVESLGIQITAQADNNFVTFLRVLTGTANDPSRRLGKLAQYLDRWVTIRSEGWEDWPSPHIGDGLPGTSPMTAWAKHTDGWSKIAERHATWLRERNCLRCGTHFDVKGHETCPRCDRPIHDLSPHDGDIRVVGVHVVAIAEAEDGSVNDAEFPECHTEHPDAASWRIQHYEPVTRADGTEHLDWIEIADGYDDLAFAEEGAQRHRRKQYYWDSISETPEGGNRPQDASAAATAHSESIEENSAAKPTNKKPTTPPKNPSRADWTGGVNDKKKETAVNLDAAKARREAEEAAKKVADLEQKLTEAERRAAAAGQQQWRAAPDDFAKAAVATDANKAIDAMEALQDALRGTQEWWAYQDELFENYARTANKIKEERDPEKRTELAADPQEQHIVRIKNALVMALRPDTDEHQRNAAFAGVLRMCEDGDLAFLDRLSTIAREPLSPTAQIVEGSPLDWFLRQTPEQLRQHAEQYADRLHELRPQISVFLKALNAVDPRRKAAENV